MHNSWMHYYCIGTLGVINGKPVQMGGERTLSDTPDYDHRLGCRSYSKKNLPEGRQQIDCKHLCICNR